LIRLGKVDQVGHLEIGSARNREAIDDARGDLETIIGGVVHVPFGGELAELREIRRRRAKSTANAARVAQTMIARNERGSMSVHARGTEAGISIVDSRIYDEFEI